MTDRGRGILLVLTATILWGAEPLWVRLVSADEWQVLFWSGALMTVVMVAWVAWEHGRNFLRSILDTGWPGLIALTSMTLAYSGYILSLNRTTVANTVVLLAIAPLIAALLGRVFLGEHLRRRTWLAMFLAFGGVLTMVSGSLGSVQLEGDLFALSTGVCFAVNIVALRSAPLRDGKPVDMMPSNAMAGIVIAVIAMFLTDPLAVASADIPYLMLIGLVAMGLGTWMFTRGVRHLQSAEAGLLCLGEAVVGPVLVWAFIGEEPTRMAMLGAAIILTALIYDTMPERRVAE
ncbi:MAG: EamA family transporter [Proteobacteria bacterium]|nr:EamA family transporter [Pseudomonadota bacterium]